ncbi:MAG: hypothetical protein QE271_09885 [Bacteriovoracaceae bacterium]|nr:hypothetical protein [Bacteriovoracaceae bacterium]
MKKSFYFFILVISFLLNSIVEANAKPGLDFYIDEYGAIDVRVLNINEIYQITQTWGANFVESSALWPILTGKHKAFGNFYDQKNPNGDGPYVLKKMMDRTLPRIEGQAYLPMSTITTMAFEKECHDRVSDGIMNFGFLSVDYVQTQFIKMEVGDSAGMGLLIIDKKPKYFFNSVVYQWIVFDSVSKCKNAIEQIKQKYSPFYYEEFLENVRIKKTGPKRSQKMLMYSGKNLSEDTVYLVKNHIYGDKSYAYPFNYFTQDKFIRASKPEK